MVQRMDKNISSWEDIEKIPEWKLAICLNYTYVNSWGSGVLVAMVTGNLIHSDTEICRML